MSYVRTPTRHMSAGVILVDREGRVLMQLRDDKPGIMFPGHWGLTGGASQPGETPEQAARREVLEETGLALERFEPFRAYYFSERRGGDGKRAANSTRANADYELYLFHAPCETLAGEMVCGEGQQLRFFSPDALSGLDIAYNHREVLDDFFASPAYAHYLSGDAFEGGERIDALERYRAELDAGTPWFAALMDAIALWETPAETVAGRQYRYLVAGEAFDWLLLAERLVEEAGERVPEGDAERLLFFGQAPASAGGALDDERLRRLIGEAKHRAHLNFVYGVTVEEALQYAAELDVAKERAVIAIRDQREDGELRDPVYERIYGRPRLELLAEFRGGAGAPRADVMSLMEVREFTYWLFQYRVTNSEPARVASDTRKALAQLSAMEDAVRRKRRAAAAAAESAQ